MPASTPASTRKRKRAQLEEEDELSAQKALSVPSAIPKKQQILLSSPSPGEGVLGTITHTLSNILNFSSKNKENRMSFDEVDELADEKDEKDIYDVPDDSPAEKRPSKSAPRGRKDLKNTRDVLAPATGKTPTFSRRKGKFDGTSGRSEDVEVDSDFEYNGTRTSQRRKAGKVGDGDSSESTKRLPHQPPMSAGFTKATKMKRAKAESRKLARQNMQADESESEGVDDTTKTKTSNGRRSSRKNEESLSPLNAEEAVPSTVGIRSNRNIERHMMESEQAPKGILTPSKGRVGRPRKSVAFEANQGEVDLGFKDLPKSAILRKSRVKEEDIYAVPEDSPSPVRQSASKRPRRKQVVVEQEHEDTNENEEESEEDTACSICSKLNSRKGNQMLLCDKCNSGCHQKCCGVLVIPEGEWFCKECAPDDLSLDTTASSLVEVEIPDISGFEDHLRKMQRIVLDKLTSQKRIALRGHDEQLRKVQQIVEQTILAGEGNSMMIIGGRGCGKTTLVESVISEISIEHRDSFHVVRLNGFLHTDDKVASREIWRQLGREMELEDDSKPSNHADTLASLLALLSHPSEITETSAEQTAKSVIFIIDEFDLFTTHPRQTLLYNLFDIAQARKAPISVLGLTTRIDVVEALEKRVKSRFSHRTVYLSFPRSPPMFWEICKEALTLNEDGAVKEGFSSSIPGRSDFLACWNTMIDNLYAEDKSFKSQVLSHYYRTKSVPAFLNSCIMPIASLSPKNFPLTGKSFAESASLLAPSDSKLHLLQGLAEVALALLIAAARLDIIHDTDTCNFAMVYDEYSSLTSRHKIQTSSSGVTALGSSAKVWGRDVALEAWEKLADCGLLVHVNIGGGGQQNVGTGGRMWKVDVGLEEIAGSVDGLSGVMAKWCREI